jgi:tRNA-(ms[2]io[6]A)-hydroxylase
VLRSPTNPKWLEIALANFDRVLVDHAHCEKKAAASAMSLVAAYPNRERLVRRLSALAIEELRHFRAVHLRLRRRGIELGRDPGDPYAQELMRLVRPGRGRLTDRLLVCGLIEARSRDRIALLAKALPDRELASFYASLAEAEGRHADLFLELAYHYEDRGQVEDRLDVLAGEEAKILGRFPIEPRMH